MLSVCLIVRDEQKVLARCLDCVKTFADEIVVCDTGSRDATVQIAESYSAKVCKFEWRDDFSAARNYCLDKASGDYVMWIDADDVVPEDTCARINALKSDLPDYDMVFMTYAAYSEKGQPSFVYYRERIFKNLPENRFCGAVHEAVIPHGRIFYLDAPIIHKSEGARDPARNLRIYQSQIMRGEKLDARARFYYGRELMRCGMLRESEAVLSDFLQGCGWVENKLEASLNLAEIRLSLGNSRGAYDALFAAFTLAPPRPRHLCAVGDILFREGNYAAAEFWYKCALSADPQERAGGFIDRDYTRFIPLMRLCAVRDRMGDYTAACDYNEQAALIKPDDGGVIYNRNYFKTKLKEVNDDTR